MTFVQGDLANPALYEALKSTLELAEATDGTAGNVIFYFAVEDRLFATMVEQLARA